MAPLPESSYQELEEMFDTLKKISHRPAGNKEAQEKALAMLHQQFEAMVARIDELRAVVTCDEDAADWIKLIAMKATLIYEQGKINLSTEKYEAAKKDMKHSLEVLNGVESDPFVSYLHQRIVNHLGFILSKLQDFTSARACLRDIVANEVTSTVVTYTTDELFTVGGIKSEDSKAKMHNIHINNLQMLSWVYSKMGLERESALIQHTILEKEMNYEQCDPVDWAMRCIRVASLYLVRRQFVAARYYLSAASSALDRAEGRLIDHPELGRAQAELARGWIYYGLKLFDMSRAKEINHMCSKIFEEHEQTQDSATNEEPVQIDAIKFHNSEVILANVPAKVIRSIVDARNLFQHTQIWLKRARVFYTLRDYPFIYVNCVLDLSELYRFLAFYEAELETQYVVHKKRADALETLSTVLKEVRPQCYIAVSVDLLRELAEVQIELLGINLKKLYKAQNFNDCPSTVKHRIESVCFIRNKLGSIGNIINNAGQGEIHYRHDVSDDIPPEAPLLECDEQNVVMAEEH